LNRHSLFSESDLSVILDQRHEPKLGLYQCIIDFRNYRAFSILDDDTTFEAVVSEAMPDGEHGREWLRGLVEDLADDELVDVEERDGETVASLSR